MFVVILRFVALRTLINKNRI